MSPPPAAGSPPHHGPYSSSGVGFLQMFMDAQRVDSAVSSDSPEEVAHDADPTDERLQ
ncbi:hypothetical protein AB0J79_11450 [Rhodococcus coprophilus]|uniref:hypothetical protein n=1 Tax=Rhodococcus coprophilus TaxID=38310 RepID=UPI00342024E5